MKAPKKVLLVEQTAPISLNAIRNGTSAQFSMGPIAHASHETYSSFGEITVSAKELIRYESDGSQTVAYTIGDIASEIVKSVDFTLGGPTWGSWMNDSGPLPDKPLPLKLWFCQDAANGDTSKIRGIPLISIPFGKRFTNIYFNSIEVPLPDPNGKPGGLYLRVKVRFYGLRYSENLQTIITAASAGSSSEGYTKTCDIHRDKNIQICDGETHSLDEIQAIELSIKPEDPVSGITVHVNERTIPLTRTSGGWYTLTTPLGAGETISMITVNSEYARISAHVKWTEPRTIILRNGFLGIVDRAETP